MIKPILAWFRGEPAGNKAGKDKGEGEKAVDKSNQSGDNANGEQSVR